MRSESAVRRDCRYRLSGRTLRANLSALAVLLRAESRRLAIVANRARRMRRAPGLHAPSRNIAISWFHNVRRDSRSAARLGVEQLVRRTSWVRLNRRRAATRRRLYSA
jgi:hypothetical protein